MSASKNRLSKFIEEYEILFFVLLFIVGIGLILLSLLIKTKTFSSIILQLGIGFITGIIISLSINKFIKIKVSMFDFSDRLIMTLSEKIPKNIAAKFAERYENIGLICNNYINTVELNINDNFIEAHIDVEFLIENTSDKELIYQLYFNSYNLDSAYNSEKKSRDGIYELLSMEIINNGDNIIKIEDIPNSLDKIQSYNDTIDEFNYRENYTFNKKIKIERIVNK